MVANSIGRCNNVLTNEIRVLWTTNGPDRRGTSRKIDNDNGKTQINAIPISQETIHKLWAIMYELYKNLVERNWEIVPFAQIVGDTIAPSENVWSIFRMTKHTGVTNRTAIAHAADSPESTLSLPILKWKNFESIEKIEFLKWLNQISDFIWFTINGNISPLFPWKWYIKLSVLGVVSKLISMTGIPKSAASGAIIATG